MTMKSIFVGKRRTACFWRSEQFTHEGNISNQKLCNGLLSPVFHLRTGQEWV